MKLELVNIPNFGWYGMSDRKGAMYKITDWKIIKEAVLIFTVVGFKEIFIIADAFDETDKAKSIDDFENMEAVSTGNDRFHTGATTYGIQEKYFIVEY